MSYLRPDILYLQEFCYQCFWEELVIKKFQCKIYWVEIHVLFGLGFLMGKWLNISYLNILFITLHT